MKEEKQNKYYKLFDFILSIDTDKEMSKYLYCKTLKDKHLQEYYYNKSLSKIMADTLTKTPILKAIFEGYKRDNFVLEELVKNNDISLSNCYYRLKKEYNKFINIIYPIEDVIYEKYIEQGEYLNESY